MFPTCFCLAEFLSSNIFAKLNSAFAKLNQSGLSSLRGQGHFQFTKDTFTGIATKIIYESIFLELQYVHDTGPISYRAQKVAKLNNILL